MTIYTLQDLMYAKGTSEPVRQALQAQAAYIAEAQALIANLTEQRDIYRAENEKLREALQAMATEFDSGDVNDGEWAAIKKARTALLPDERDNLLNGG